MNNRKSPCSLLAVVRDEEAVRLYAKDVGHAANRIGRPKVLDKSKAGLAQRMHASGESASTIANTLGVSGATVYRVLTEQTAEGD